MSHFRIDLCDGAPPVTFDLNEADSKRFVAFMYEAHATHVALRDAIHALEGWVAWKCPRAHKAEHLAFIERLRAVLGDAPKPPEQPH